MKSRLLLATALIGYFIATPAWAGFTLVAPDASATQAPTAPVAPVQSKTIQNNPSQNNTVTRTRVGPPVIELSAIPAPTIAPQPMAQISAPQPAVMAPVSMTAAEKTVSGFGKDIPLVIAAQQIAPADRQIAFGKGVDPSMPISWKGGKGWHHVLGSALNQRGLQMAEQGNLLFISQSSTNVGAPKASLLMQPRNTNDAMAASPVAPMPMASMSATNNMPMPVAPASVPTNNWAPPQDINAAYREPPAAPAMPPMMMQPAPVAAPVAMQAPTPAMLPYDAPVIPAASMQTVPAPAPVQTMAAPAPVQNTVIPAQTMVAPQNPQPVMMPPVVQPVAQPIAQPAAIPPAVAAPLPNITQAVPTSALAAAPKAIEPAITNPVITNVDSGEPWFASMGRSLKQTLEIWSKRANVTLRWDSEFDYPVQTDVSIKGDYESAVRTLLHGFSSAQPQPVARLYRPEHGMPGVLLVSTRGNDMSSGL